MMYNPFSFLSVFTFPFLIISFKAVSQDIYIFDNQEVISILKNETSSKNSKNKIAKISFEGLKKTKESYLKRILSIQIGSTFSDAILKSEAQKLSNLNIFATAEFKTICTENSCEIIFKVVEKTTLLPFFFFSTNNDFHLLQLGIQEVNWLGRNNNLTLVYQYYDRHSVALNYKVFNFGGTKFGFGMDLKKWSTIEPLYFEQEDLQYNFDSYTFQLSEIYSFDTQHYIEFSEAILIENYERLKDQSETSAGDLDVFSPKELQTTKFLFQINHRLKRINYFWFYQNGFENSTDFQAVITKGVKMQFLKFGNETLFFKRIQKKGNLAARIRIGFATNTDSPFSPFVQDNYLNIRGIGNRVARGTAEFTFNLEYRQTLYDKSAKHIGGHSYKVSILLH